MRGHGLGTAGRPGGARRRAGQVGHYRRRETSGAGTHGHGLSTRRGFRFICGHGTHETAWHSRRIANPSEHLDTIPLTLPEGRAAQKTKHSCPHLTQAQTGPAPSQDKGTGPAS